MRNVPVAKTQTMSHACATRTITPRAGRVSPFFPCSFFVSPFFQLATLSSVFPSCFHLAPFSTLSSFVHPFSLFLSVFSLSPLPRFPFAPCLYPHLGSYSNLVAHLLSPTTFAAATTSTTPTTSTPSTRCAPATAPMIALTLSLALTLTPSRIRGGMITITIAVKLIKGCLNPGSVKVCL